ncbi:MAG: biotin--[acetyl-CoA-carboxylase] ligase [Pirellulaceae bacterium]
MNSFDLPRIERDADLAAIEFHARIGSTNTRAVELAQRPDLPSPLLVLADEQFAGRGRGTNQWWAGSGGLTFSLVIRPDAAAFPRRNWPLVSLTTALSVAQVLESRVPHAAVRIKWPNDVYVNGRKICGILVETSGNRAERLILGIGLNVNNSLSSAPIELQSIATALIDVAARPFDRTEILIAVLQRLQQLLRTLAGETWPLADAWRQRCYLQGRTVQLDSSGRLTTGVCQGIDDEGALLLLTDGGVQRCLGGVVSRIL